MLNCIAEIQKTFFQKLFIFLTYMKNMLIYTAEIIFILLMPYSKASPFEMVSYFFPHSLFGSLTFDKLIFKTGLEF